MTSLGTLPGAEPGAGPASAGSKIGARTVLAPRRRGQLFPLVLPLLLGGGCAQPSVRPETAPSAAAAAVAPAEVTVALVGTSDLHGYVEPRQLKVTGREGAARTINRGGLALFGGFLDNLRRRYPVLLLDAGDLFQGTMVSNLEEGQAVIDAYNVLHYDGAALGNHEFDYGPVGPVAVATKPEDDPTGALKARVAAAKFPFLAANVLDKATGQPVTWPNIYPSRKLVIGGVPIGVIGAVTEDTPRTTNMLNLRDVTIGQIVPAVQAQAQALRQQGVAAVVLTVHEGANCSSFTNPRDITACTNNDERVLTLVRALGGAVDAVVGGHSHAGVAHFVGDVPIVQSFAMGVAFGRIDLVFRRQPSAPSGFVLDKTRTQIHPPTELCAVALPPPGTVAEASPASEAPAGAEVATPGTPPPPRPAFRCDAKLLSGTALSPMQYEGQPVIASADVEAALAPHIAKAAAQRASPLGVSLAVRLHRNYRKESPLGAFLADLIRTGAARATGEPVDFAFQNGGGVRNELPIGPLQYGHLFEVLPFDNRLAFLFLTGAKLNELIYNNLQGSHGVLVPSGMTIDASCVGAKLTVTLRGPDNKPLDAKKTYTVAVSDFLATGGDNFGAILTSLPPSTVRYFDNIMLREVVLEELKRYRGPFLTAPDTVPHRMNLAMERPMKCQEPAHPK